MAAGGVVSYDEAQADTSSSGLKNTIAECEGSMSDLTGFVHRACANWTGDEQEIYKGVQAEWDKSQNVIQDILVSIQKGLDANTVQVKDMRGKVRSALKA